MRPSGGIITPTKTRILAGGIHSAKQQVVRIDRAAGTTLSDDERRAIESRVLDAAKRCDAMLVSDYGAGLVAPAAVSAAAALLRERRAPLLVDSR